MGNVHGYLRQNTQSDKISHLLRQVVKLAIRLPFTHTVEMEIYFWLIWLVETEIKISREGMGPKVKKKRKEGLWAYFVEKLSPYLNKSSSAHKHRDVCHSHF